MTVFALVVHEERGEAKVVAQRAAAWLRDRGHKVVMPAADAHTAGLPDAAASEHELEAAEVVVTMGGDGTILRSVNEVARNGQLILGVNVGQLGYLAEIEPVALEPTLELVLDKQYQLDERMMVQIEVFSAAGQRMEVHHALNEAVVERTLPGHTVRLSVQIDGTPFTTYAADGLIVATPTGSTAYSLSVGGPIISPGHRALVLSPVAPHMLFNRPLVLAPTQSLAIEVLGWRTAALSLDGRPAGTLEEGDRVVCTASDRLARFVRFGSRTFHQILKQKFGLAER